MNVPLKKPMTCSTFIGRETHLATMHHMLALAHNGNGLVTLVSGEAGVGKSRLVAEVKRHAAGQGFLLLEGHCFESDRSYPYALFLDVLHTLLSASPSLDLSPLFGPFAQDLSRLFPDLGIQRSAHPTDAVLSPEQEKHRVFAAWTHFFTTQAREQPILLVIEDLQWCDNASLEFLLVLARQMACLPSLLLLTYRQDEVPAPLSHFLACLDRERRASECVLPRLTSAEVGAMVAAIFQTTDPVERSTLTALYTLTEGNPFFLEELLSSLAATGTTLYEHGVWKREALDQVQIPRSIQDAVQQRVAHLSQEARRVLSLAAVAGRRFDFTLVQQLTSYEEQQLLALLKELLDAQFVVEESAEQFAFRHALTRHAIYAKLLVRERRGLHLSIAQALVSLSALSPATHLSDLATHYYGAAAWPEALVYTQRLGEQALALYAPREAIEHFTRAVIAAQQVDSAPLAPLYRSRGQAYETLGEFELARQDYERALRASQEAADGREAWHSLMALGLLWAGRDYAQAGVFFHQGLHLAQHLNDPTLHARSLNRLGNWHANIGQGTEALRLHGEALALFQTQQDTRSIAETLDLLGLTNAQYGESGNAVLQYGRAIDLFHALGMQQGLVGSLPILVAQASPAICETVSIVPWQLSHCEAVLTEALQIARQIEWRAGEALVEFSSGVIFASFGQFEAGLAHAKQGLRLATEIDHRQWIAGAHSYLGHIYVLLLEPTLALHHLTTGLSQAQALGSAWWTGHITADLALAYLLKSEIKRAEETLQAIMPREQLPRMLPERRMVWVWGELALVQGQPATALQIAEQLIQSASGATGGAQMQPIPWLLKLKGEALMALARGDEAVAALEQARSGAQGRGEAPLLWRIHGKLGHAYRSLGRTEDAQAAFTSARAVIASLAQTLEETELRERFLSSALAFLPKAKAPSIRQAEAEKLSGLTAREREVALLIAQGKTNQAIADLLIVSKRTVETHINNTMFKLGFTSRTQIAAWAAEKGLAHQTE